MRASRGWGVLALVATLACRQLTPDEILQTWPEGVLPEHQELHQEWWDGIDNDAVSFSYRIPPHARATAIEKLRQQIHRTAGRASRPWESCFEVIEQTTDYLLTSCKPEEILHYQIPQAWEVRLMGEVVTVTTGSPYVVKYNLVGPPNKPSAR